MQNGCRNDAGHTHARGRASASDTDAEVESLASQLELVPNLSNIGARGPEI